VSQFPPPSRSPERPRAGAFQIFDEQFLRKLERLSLIVRQVRAGRTRGERRSTKRGPGIEFADYRDYARGDDPRHVDWNIYARLERPFVKLFEEEEDLSVHLLLDASRSMDWAEGDAHKWTYARRVAASLGYVALASGDPLIVAGLYALGENGVPSPGAKDGGPRRKAWGPHRNRAQLHRLLAWLDVLPARGETDLNRSLLDYARQPARAGLCFVLTDGFSPGGMEEGLSALRAQGHDVVLLHLLAPDEEEPALGGDLRLVDVETGSVQEVTVDGGLRAAYRLRLASWQSHLAAFCAQRDIRYLPIKTDQPFDDLILTHFRRLGLIR
jgi:uncharacterized protein (DUF58 family)